MKMIFRIYASTNNILANIAKNKEVEIISNSVVALTDFKVQSKQLLLNFPLPNKEQDYRSTLNNIADKYNFWKGGEQTSVAHNIYQALIKTQTSPSRPDICFYKVATLGYAAKLGDAVITNAH
jgi:hypothetical protein